MFSGQYSFISGILEDVFVRPEVELTMEITRKQVFRDVEKDYDSVEEEVTIVVGDGVVSEKEALSTARCRAGRV